MEIAMDEVPDRDQSLNHMSETKPIELWTPGSPLLDKGGLQRLRRRRWHVRNWRATAIMLTLAVVIITTSLALTVRNPDDHIATRIQAPFDKDVSVSSINSPSGTIDPGNVVVNATIMNTGNLASGVFQVNLTVTQTGLPVPGFNDSFETGSVPPPGYGDYSTGSQIWLTTISSPHYGIRSLVARQELYGNALLGSPPINVSSDAVLKFWAKYSGSGGLSNLIISASTSGHTWANLVTSPDVVLRSLNTSPTGEIKNVWTQYSCDLSGFAAQPIYIGFLHNQPLLGHDMCLDDVTVENLTGSNVVFSDTVPVFNLDAGSSMFVEFSPWTAAAGKYSVEVNVYLVGDQDPTNDLVKANVAVEPVVIPEFPSAVVSAVAMAMILLVGRRRHRGSYTGIR
jgi:hypothetical protein